MPPGRLPLTRRVGLRIVLGSALFLSGAFNLAYVFSSTLLARPGPSRQSKVETWADLLFGIGFVMTGIFLVLRPRVGRVLGMCLLALVMILMLGYATGFIRPL